MTHINTSFPDLCEGKMERVGDASARDFKLNAADRRAVEYIVGKHHVATPFETIENDVRDRILKHNRPAPAEHIIAAYVRHARTAHNRNRKEYGRVMGGNLGSSRKRKQ